MGIFDCLVLVIAIILIIVIVLKPKDKQINETLLNQEISIAEKEAELKHIYWQISEIERLSKEKTKAIRSGDMVLYKKLCEENDLLRLGFKRNK